jgi:hypothetical protein
MEVEVEAMTHMAMAQGVEEVDAMMIVVVEEVSQWESGGAARRPLCRRETHIGEAGAEEAEVVDVGGGSTPSTS